MPIGTAQQGVMIPKDQLSSGEEGPPMTVRFAGPMQPIQVQWFDETGRGHAEVWFVGPGNVVYQPPNSEAWASELSPVKAELAEQVMAHLGHDRAKTAKAPDDAVDVLGGEKEADGASAASP